MATEVMTGHVNEKTVRSAAGASAQTTTPDAPLLGMSTVIDGIWVSNTAGGTAVSATVSVQRVSDSAVLWEQDVSGGAPAAPQLYQQIAIPGGVYKGLKDIALKVVVTMTAATAIKTVVKYHDEISTA